MADTLNQKILNTRIKLKYDSYENWLTNNPVLLAGEVALVYVPADKVAEVGEHNLTGTTPPHVLMKVGDGTSNFNSLKYVSALAADVNSYAKMKAADFEAQVKALANAQVSESIQANADAIDALEALVGTESVTTQIANAIAALDLANTYAAKEHTHTKDEITDFAHTHTAAEITDLDSTIKGYDYATKGELGDVDAKFADYKKAADQKLIDDEQDRRLGVIEGDYLKEADIANFETKENVKKVADDLAGYIESNNAAIADRYTKSEADAKFALIADAYDDEEVRGLISANAKAIADEESRAKGVEEGLQTQINTIINNPDAEGIINSINEFTQYIEDHGEIAEGFRTDINKNKEDIAAINNAETGILKQAKDYADGLAGNYAEAEHDHVVADITDFETVVEARITAKGYATTGYADQAEADAKAHADGLNTAMDTRVAALEGIDHEAYIGADEALKSELEGKINAIDNHSHTNKDIIDGITAEKVSAWDAAEKNAKDYSDGKLAEAKTAISAEIDADVKAASEALTAEINKKANDADLAAIAKTGSTDDLVQGAKVLVFDCGDSKI
jgi:hypothetical protein